MKAMKPKKTKPRPSLPRRVKRQTHWALISWMSARTSRGWSIRDAAKASHVSAAQISRFERGMDIKVSTLDKLFTATRLVPIVFYDPPKHESATETKPLTPS